MNIPDFTEAEQQLISHILLERYKLLVPWQLAEAELQLDPSSEDLTVCPTLYWSQRGAEFIVCKLGDSRFRCQFFYSEQEQFGTGRDIYDDLGDCVVTLLQVQADHERTRAGANKGVGAGTPEEDEYFGPTVI
jgi:hypothetical protein